MRMHIVLVPAILAVSVFAQVKIEQPSPYMSSPPPALADTTVVDPGRKPNCEVQPGLTEAYYADWDLATDRPSAGPLEAKGPRKGMATYRAAFDDNGWPTEVVYYDTKMRPQWTKLFKYPAKIPSGPGDVPYTANWIGSNGRAIQMGKIADQFKSTPWVVGMKKYEVGDILGQPLIIEELAGGSRFSGKPEAWVYWVDGQVIRFVFDKDNRLVQRPQDAPLEVASAPADNTGVTSAPTDTTKAKSAIEAAKAGEPSDSAMAKPAADTAVVPKGKSGKKKAK